MSEVLTRPPAAQPAMTLDELIEKYVAVRDKKKLVEDRHKLELVPYGQVMDRIEGHLLEALNGANLSSIRSPHGTAYKSVRTSAKVTDREAMLTFVRTQNAWDLLESRVSKLAAQQIIEETKRPIPGVETTSEVCVNVRRAADGGK